MQIPSNLSRRANREINAILARSARLFGRSQAERLQTTLYAKCSAIAEGLDIGHRRNIASSGIQARFLVSHPFIIVYDPETRIVDRVVDGRRDLPILLR